MVKSIGRSKQYYTVYHPNGKRSLAKRTGADYQMSRSDSRIPGKPKESKYVSQPLPKEIRSLAARLATVGNQVKEATDLLTKRLNSDVVGYLNTFLSEPVKPFIGPKDNSLAGKLDKRKGMKFVFKK